jgi:hypothetical protein
MLRYQAGLAAVPPAAATISQEPSLPENPATGVVRAVPLLRPMVVRSRTSHPIILRKTVRPTRVNAGAFHHRSNRPDARRFPRVPSGVSKLVGLPLHGDITHLRAVVFMIGHRIAPHKWGRTGTTAGIVSTSAVDEHDAPEVRTFCPGAATIAGVCLTLSRERTVWHTLAHRGTGGIRLAVTVPAVLPGRRSCSGSGVPSGSAVLRR